MSTQLMNIFEMAETVNNWIGGCANQIQLNACQDIIDEYIIRRYKNHVSQKEMGEVLTALQKAISDRKEILGGVGIEQLN